MNDIPAYDLRIITAGVRDKDEMLRLRFAYVYGFEAGRSAAVSAIHGVKAPPSNWPEKNMEEDVSGRPKGSGLFTALRRAFFGLNRDERLELHILDTAAKAARTGKPHLMPNLVGYSRSEVNMKIRDLVARGYLIAGTVDGGSGEAGEHVR